jgi:hypothetical protein
MNAGVQTARQMPKGIWSWYRIHHLLRFQFRHNPRPQPRFRQPANFPFDSSAPKPYGPEEARLLTFGSLLTAATFVHHSHFSETASR